MFWILLLLFSVAHASPVRVCVSEKLSQTCNQMAVDLPDTFSCVTTSNLFGCLKKVKRGNADLIMANPYTLYVGGKYFKLRPIATELIDGEPFIYQSIALVRKDSNIKLARDLRNKQSCHTGLGLEHWSGWNIPLGRLLSSGVMSPDCDDGELAAVQNFFAGSCVPGQWSSDPIVEEKLKTKYSKLCSRCKNPSTCAADDAYAGNKGVMQCLADGAADVAFTNIPALKDYLEQNPEFADKAEILCFEGGRKSVRDKDPCVWGDYPSKVFLTRSEEAERLLGILLQTQARYSVTQVGIPEWYYKTFFSHPNASALSPVGHDRRNYIDYLGDLINAIRRPNKGCENVKDNEATLCTPEYSSCEDMAMVADVFGFWPVLKCIKATTAADCMQILKDDKAQLLELDAGNVYKAGRYFDLQPIASLLYNDAHDGYYAVAVIRSTSNVTELLNLRGLRSCHTGFGQNAGWVMPVGSLVTAGLLSSENNDCNLAKGMTEFFSAGSCVPGANNPKYNPYTRRTEDLCKHCVGNEEGEHKCSRDFKERFNGDAGALRCLAEGKGDVAFIEDTTVSDYTDGYSQLPWAKDLLSSDFKLLCDKGGTAPVTHFKDCNLGKVPSGQMVTKKGISGNKWLNLARLLANFNTGTPSFLKVVPLETSYEEVLGRKFLEASKALDPKIASTPSPFVVYSTIFCILAPS